MNQDLGLIFPADLESRACYIQKLKSTDWPQEFSKEICCGRRVGQEGVSPSVCYKPVDDLLYLGPGAQLLFVFTQNATATLLLFTGIFALFAIITNLLGKCAISFLNRISIANKIDDELSIIAQSFLISAYLILYAVIAQFFIWRIRTKSQESDALFRTPSDYSIIIKNCPPEVNEEQITHMIQAHRRLLNYEQKACTNNLAIAQIIISYSLKEYLSLKSKQQKEFLKSKKKDSNCQFIIEPIPKPTAPAGLAVVVFQRSTSKQMFWDSQQQGCSGLFVDWCNDQGNFQIGENYVEIQRAPQPDDIIWENADISQGQSRRRKVISYILGGVILGIGGVLQYYLQWFQVRIDDPPTQAWFSYVSSALVTIFNIVIVQFLIAATSWEGQLTRTGLNQSLMIKISIYSFFNTGIFYTLASILAQREGQFDIQGDVSFEVSLFMALNAVTPHLTSLLLNKIQFPNVFIRYLLSKDFLKYNQHDANQVFELPSANFSVQYAYVVKTVWLTCFYAPFVPIVAPISIVGLTVFYFTQSELFRTKYKVPTLLSASITMAATRLMDFTGIIMSSGQLIIIIYLKIQFNQSFTIDQKASIGLGMTLGGLLVLMPSNKINRQLFSLNSSQSQNQTYDQAKESFQVTYEGTNPAGDVKDVKRRSDLHLLTALRFRQNSQRGQAMRQLSDFTQRTPLKRNLDFQGELSVQLIKRIRKHLNLDPLSKSTVLTKAQLLAYARDIHNQNCAAREIIKPQIGLQLQYIERESQEKKISLLAAENTLRQEKYKLAMLESSIKHYQQYISDSREQLRLCKADLLQLKNILSGQGRKLQLSSFELLLQDKLGQGTENQKPILHLMKQFLDLNRSRENALNRSKQEDK